MPDFAMYPGGTPSVNMATVSNPPVTAPAKYHHGAVWNHTARPVATTIAGMQAMRTGRRIRRR